MREGVNLVKKRIAYVEAREGDEINYGIEE